MLFCGIDTSNYTTSAALCDGEGNIRANIKAPLPVGSGACGLRQSDAVFAHIRNLPEVMGRLRAALDAAGEPVTAVGVSVKPRDAADSYMPCFLAGKAAAASFCAAGDLPAFEFSHQQGHIMAAYHTSGASRMPDASASPFLAFHVSGGTTEVVLVSPKDAGFEIELIGGTNDVNAGQIIDRTGVLLGLPFPCGAAMEKIALAADPALRLPAWRVCVQGIRCSLSGLQNLAANLHAQNAPDGLVCSAVFDFIARTLLKMAENAREQYGDLPVVWAGGVMSNSIIKSRLACGGNMFFTEPQYSADNAVGIALLCRRKYLEMSESHG